MAQIETYPIPQFTQSEADKAFAEVLSNLKPTREDHARAPIEEAFNWTELAQQLGSDLEGTWYIAWFQSQQKPEFDAALMDDIHDAVYSAAKEGQGLLKFWYGDKDHERVGLALSFWISHEAAKKIIRSPIHARAYKHHGQFYDQYKIKRYHLAKKAGELGFHFEEF
ncbi:hypothetical protein EC973_001399 [Apophysomyces ossiformis]|uniref:Uncharacterized protein n=1 Tax=Apophysomyces ossiformis TaxID=679940 RepID=A0A8H7BHZ5_9FUNG|nr:hypothetical protein EC973_001399 [Apophysomyces ossiformis]